MGSEICMPIFDTQTKGFWLIWHFTHTEENFCIPQQSSGRP